MVLPPISMKKGSVVIKKGELISGQINKSVSKKIVHIIFNEFGYKRTREYINNI